MAEVHDLTIKTNGDAACSCGTKLPPGQTPAQSVKNWEHHNKTRELLYLVATSAQVEQKARENTEKYVRQLNDLGVSSRWISAATKIDGKPLLSPTVIQRLAREEHKQSPRRRRKA